MALRYYRNGPARALAFPIALSSDTSMTVDSASGFPTQFPYTLIIEPDTALEEVVDVTAAVGNILTITRGVDSTTASAHAAGSVVYHGISARDPREANAHVNQTTGAHGTTGSLVDTDSAQTITGAKNFTGGLTTTAGDVVAVGGSQTITGTKTFDTLKTTAGGDVVALAGAQTITGAKVFTGNQTFNGNNVNTGTESHSGAQTFTGAASFSQPVTLTSTLTIGGEQLTGGWTTYTAERHNGTGGANLSTGNGTLVARYKKLGDKTVHFHITLTFGSTTNIGTDDYEFTLPFSMSPFRQGGTVILFDSNIGKHFARTWHGVGTNGIVIVDEAGNRATGLSSGSPMNWATGDVIAISGAYEAA